MKDYARRFRRILRRATQDQALADRYQVNYFINGLLPIFVSQVVIANPDTLNATIERAKLVETGIKYTLQSVDITTSVNQPAPATKAAIDPVEDLTKQLQQLSLNMANISTAMLAQRPQEPKTQIFTPNSTRNNNNRNANIQCFNCGLKGHIAQNCTQPRQRRSTPGSFGKRT